MSSTYEYESTAHEAEAFMESVSQAARSGRRYRPLALAAMAAARAALSEGRYPDVESELEGALEGEWESTPQAFHQSFVNHEAAPSAALMEHLGHAAAEAESNGEAFAFLAPLIPLALKALPLATKVLGMGAKKLLPNVASKVFKVAPKLIKGVNAAAKSLRSNPATKQLVQALPQVVRRTTADLAQQVAQGKPLNGNIAARALANQTARLLGNPQAAMQALGRARALDQKIDQAVTSMVQGSNGGSSDDDGGASDLTEFLRGSGGGVPCTCGAQPQ